MSVGQKTIGHKVLNRIFVEFFIRICSSIENAFLTRKKILEFKFVSSQNWVFLFPLSSVSDTYINKWRQDTQHNDIQPNGTQHNIPQHTSNVWSSECSYLIQTIILNAIVLSVVKVSVTLLKVMAPNKLTSGALVSSQT